MILPIPIDSDLARAFAIAQRIARYTAFIAAPLGFIQDITQGLTSIRIGTKLLENPLFWGLVRRGGYIT